MKRRIIVLVTVGVLCLWPLTGCGKSSVPSPITTGFSCQMTAQYNGLSLQGELTRDTDGTMHVTFSEPKSLSGIGIGFDGTDFTMEMAGMHIAVSPESVPSGALIQSLLTVLNRPPQDGEVTEEGLVITGVKENKAYTMVCDPVTGFPRSVSVPEDDLSATFTESKSVSEE